MWESIRAATQTWPQVQLAKRIGLIREIRRLVNEHARQWVEQSSQAKSLATSAQRSEEILAGPVSVVRYLTILLQNLESILQRQTVKLPGTIRELASGKLSVPVFPVPSLYDPLLFWGLRADVWMQPGIKRQQIHGNLLEPILAPPNPAPVSVVLGAGNVSVIPMTDALAKLFQESHVVILKLNPVNDYLKEVFSQVLAPVIEPGWLTIMTGGADVGKQLVESPETTAVHITGSQQSHDAIVWGNSPQQRAERKRENRPLLDKPITSELGNVSPWMIVPGNYSQRQLELQAINIAAALTNNSGFNCLTPRVLVTASTWPQREQFLSLLKQNLSMIPARVPYYPGSLERYEQFLGQAAPLAANGTLPWQLLTNFPADEPCRLFAEESFLPVCVEVGLAAQTPEEFLRTAVEFCNERLYGTLSASLTCPDLFRKRQRRLLEEQIDRLRYGAVCINQWAGLVYALMTPPWGGAPGATLTKIQSGRGSVHNLYFLDQFDKTVFAGPLCNFPKPIWSPTHTQAENVAWKLLHLYLHPSPLKLPGLFTSALLG